MDSAALVAAGYVQSEDLQAAHEDNATSLGKHTGGAYTVLGVWTKGLVTLLFEQNIATEDIGGLDAALTHPAVCVVTGPSGTVACNANDTELIFAMAEEHSL